MTGVRRFSSFVMALAIAFAPVALAACEASCTSQTQAGARAGAHSHHAAAKAGVGSQVTAHGHHHHHDAAPPDTVKAGVSSAITAVPNACAHGGDLPVVDGAMHVVAAASAIVPDIVMPVAAPPLIASVAGAPERSPGPTALTTQLRV